MYFLESMGTEMGEQLIAVLRCHVAGQHHAAQKTVQNLLEKNSDRVLVHGTLGQLFLEMNQTEPGLDYMAKAVSAALIQRDADALFSLGNIFLSFERLIEAKTSYRYALQIDPEHVNAMCNLASSLMKLGRLHDAEQLCRQALQLQPDHTESHINLGLALKKMGKPTLALACYQDALNCKPDCALAHYNRGVIFKELGQFAPAAACFEQAVSISPHFVEALGNLGSVLGKQGKLREAQNCYRRVLQLKPDCDSTLLNLGFALLGDGQYAEGWEKFEHRWQGASVKSQPPKSVLPQWKGQATAKGDSILIFHEQGLGDMIQFSRYLRFLNQYFSGGVSMTVDRKLLPLFQRSFPACQFLDYVPADQHHWQWQCPLLSLPLAFNGLINTVPQFPSYLSPDPNRVQYFERKITQSGLPTPARKIGLVWKTAGAMANAASRSLQFSQVASLFGLPDTAWFSLQKEPGPDQFQFKLHPELIDWSHEFSNFDDTAALIANLDLVIAIDTSVAHLAAALGKPVWLLNRYESEWRWMRNRMDSPWYPGLRIFTQTITGTWDDVIARVAKDLVCRAHTPETVRRTPRFA
ncbi:Tfp pilus assembly protein PilF [Oxalobacteraceae bacterium GrIS 2.11]